MNIVDKTGDAELKYRACSATLTCWPVRSGDHRVEDQEVTRHGSRHSCGIPQARLCGGR